MAPGSSRVHPLVRLDYLVRFLGCPMAAGLIVSARAEDGMPLALWAYIAVYALVWPHVAYLIAKRAADSRVAEHRLLFVDCLGAGAGIALCAFRPMPSLAFLLCHAAFMASIGGWSLLVLGLGVLAAGTALTASLVTGWAFDMSTSVLSTFLSSALMFAFQLMLGIQTWRTARGFVASRRQITEQAGEIQRQNAALVEAREEALQAANAKAAFLATMSHEIRTPLNGVLGMTRLLTETPLNPEQRDFVGTIQVSGTALLAIINDILDYSKIESGRLDLESEPLRVAEVVEEALEIVAERAREKNLELIHQVAPDVPEVVLGDVTWLRQVLTNLAGNAVKFTERGEVMVAVRLVARETDDEPATLAFDVRDTGIGIPEDRIGHLFTAFTQVDASTTRRYGGTGLGLVISKRLTELMGGTVTVRSEPGQGSTFTFTVQARAARLETPARRLEAAAIAGRRILVVDDNATNRRVLCAQLAAWGFDAQGVPGAADALLQLTAGEPWDLAVLDLHMPDVDGLELARRMRKTAAGEHLPLVLLSSSQLPAAEAEGLFAARLLKPARQSRLFDAVSGALGARVMTADTLVPTAARRLSDLAPLRILVVDDNEVNRKLAGLVLRRFGFKADFAQDGRQAFDTILRHAIGADREEPYDLVFMDVHMPEMDGLEATRAVRAQQEERPEHRWPRIVAMTADAMQGDREVCLEAGMDDYLTKPLDFAAVQAVLEREVAARTTERAEPAPPAEAAAPAPAERAAPLMDWSRLDELREWDTPDGAVVRAAIASFLEQGPARLSELLEGTSRGDAPAVRESAHGLKGAASNVGAVALAAEASEIELAGRRGELDGLLPRVRGLQATLERTLGAIRERDA